MPLYEYHCDACRREFELLVSSHEQPQCPDCGSEQLSKLFSVVAGHTLGKPSSANDSGGACGRPQCGQGRCAGLG